MDDQIVRVARTMYADIGTPLAKEALSLLNEGRYTELQKLSVDPRTYEDATAYHKDACVVSLLRKLPLPGEAERKYEAAVDAFLSCERRNYVTNHRFSAIIAGDEDGKLLDFVSKVRKHCRDIVGPLPLDLVPRFSSGATVSDKALFTTLPDKLTSKPTFYENSVSILPLWEDCAWGRACREIGNYPVFVRSNCFFTVPKDNETDRGCAKEASGSLSYQLAVGSFFKKKLSRAFGRDFRKSPDVHRTMSEAASLTGDLVTIDLKNASNNVAREPIRATFSKLWYELLDTLRARSILIDGKPHVLEMFSSMGNGFTFELETILFLSIARATADIHGLGYEDIYVFGDDIICPQVMAQDLLAALAYYGFEPNTKKTFLAGPFRESCGGDYFNGQAVRPFFLKKFPETPLDWVAFANGLWRLPHVFTRRARQECLKNIPKVYRDCCGPEALGDIVIHSDPVHWTIKRRRPRNESVYVDMVRALKPIPLVLPWSHWKPPVVYASALAGAESDGVTPRDGVKGFRVSWVTMPGSAWLPR